LGFVLALLLLFGSFYMRWNFVVFPTWVLLISVYILVDNIAGQSKAVPKNGA
jgi:hypothetical protein